MAAIITVEIVETSHDPTDGHSWTAKVTCGGATCNLSIKKPIKDSVEPEIEWYLEKYIFNDPYLIERAAACEQAIDFYTSDLAGQLATALEECTHSQGLSRSESLRLEFVSHDAASTFQSLHWELLEGADWSCSPFAGVVVSRRLEIPVTSANDRSAHGFGGVLRILFVSARPYKSRDVDYLLLSKPLADLAAQPQHASTCVLDFVRPGTWPMTYVELLAKQPGYYSIVHLDLHGVIREGVSHLLFASEVPKTPIASVKASEVAQLLARAQVPIVVLNACNSANAREQHQANLAQTLIASGVDIVVAMSYAVLAQSAEMFVKEFYQSILIGELDLDESAAAGRRCLRDTKHRRGGFGLMKVLRDHFVPVVYKAKTGSQRMDQPNLSDSFRQLSLIIKKPTPPSITGRDIDILNLENMLARRRVVYVYGPGGVGKTSLVHFLIRWWAQTACFEHISAISCRDLFSEGINSLEQRFDFLTRSAATGKGAKISKGSGTTPIWARGRHLVFIDGSETIDEGSGLDQYNLPVLSSEKSMALKELLRSRSQPENAAWTFVVLSRTNTIAGNPIGLGSGVTARLDAGYYELANLSSRHAIQIAERRLSQGYISSAAHDRFVNQLSDLLSLHDNNAMFAAMVSECFDTQNPSIHDVAMELQMCVPRAMREALAFNTNELRPDHLGILADFAHVTRPLQRDYPLVHRMMLTWAPFRQHSLNMNNCGAWYLGLMSCGIVSDPTFGPDYRLSLPTGREWGRETNQHDEAVRLTPDLRNAFKDGIKILKAVGLVEDAIDLNSDIHYKLHPLLPYILRVEAARLDDSVEFIRHLDLNFRETYDFLSSLFENKPNVTPAFVEVEWLNVCRAVDVCIDTADLLNERLEAVFALRFALIGRRRERLSTSLSLLKRVIERFRAIAAELPGGVLTSLALEKTMRICRLMLSVYGEFASFDVDDGDLGTLIMILDMYEKSVEAHGAPEPHTFCTAFAVKTTMLKFGLFDATRRNKLFDEVWDAQIDKNRTKQDAAFFYDTSINHLTSLLTDRSGPWQATHPPSRIKAKLDELVNAIHKEELPANFIKIAEAKIAMAGAGVEHLEGLEGSMDEGARARAIIAATPGLRDLGLEGEDPIAVSVVATAARPDVASERAILLNGLSYARLRNKRYDQRSLHWRLWRAARDARQADNMAVHFDEFVRLDRVLVVDSAQPPASPGMLPSQHSQLRVSRECMMGLTTGEVLMHAYYNTAACAERKGQVRIYFERSLVLSLENNLMNHLRRSFALLGDWEALMNKTPEAAHGHYASALHLPAARGQGDDNGGDGDGDKPLRSAFGELSHGGFARLLVRIFKETSAAGKAAIARHVGSSLQRDAVGIQVLIEMFARCLWIDSPATTAGTGSGGEVFVIGPRAEDYTAEALKPFFAECQAILLETVDSDDTLAFWRLQRDGNLFEWSVRRDVMARSVIDAMVAGSAKRHGAAQAMRGG